MGRAANTPMMTKLFWKPTSDTCASAVFDSCTATLFHHHTNLHHAERKKGEGRRNGRKKERKI